MCRGSGSSSTCGELFVPDFFKPVRQADVLIHFLGARLVRRADLL
jgi:hypothetical protein